MSVSRPSPVPAPAPRDHPSAVCDWLSLPGGPCGWRDCRVLCGRLLAPRLRFSGLVHVVAGVRTSFCRHVTCHGRGKPHLTHPSLREGSGVGRTSVLRPFGLVPGAELLGAWPVPQRPRGSTAHHGGGSVPLRLDQRWPPPVPACGRFSQGVAGVLRS